MYCQTQTPFLTPLQPTWIDTLHAQKISPKAKSWLMTTGSLSDRIRKLSTTFAVERLGLEQKGCWQSQETSYFHPQQEVVRRCVLLKSDNIPWVYAQSYFPLTLWEAHFTGLNQSSLGDVLFNTYRCWRSCLRIGDFRQTARECSHIKELNLFPSHPKQKYLGRRSWFYFHTQSIMIDEVFLPSSPVFS